jgi:hypothetical protein
VGGGLGPGVRCCIVVLGQGPWQASNWQLLKNPLGESRATPPPPQPFRPRPRHFLERLLAPPAACSSGQG